MSLEPGVLAWADQRIAEAGEFLSLLAETQRIDMQRTGTTVADAVAVNALSAFLEYRLTSESAIADLLALAIRRLAAQ